MAARGYPLRDKAAVVGVGYTEYSKRSGVSTLTLALRAIRAALHDAGLSARDLDGVACHRLGDSVEPSRVAQVLGIPDPCFVHDTFGGGSASSGVIGAAATAVATGRARAVVCWRALNARSGVRMGGPAIAAVVSGDTQYWAPYRHLRAAQVLAMYARAYMHAHGVTAEDLGRVAMDQRAKAALSPRAMMTTPMSMDDYLGSRWIVEPLRLLDCCLETDAAVALIVTSTSRARDLAQRPVSVTAVATGGGTSLISHHASDLAAIPAAVMAPRLWAAAGLGPAEVDVAQLYDAFTPLVLMQLEAYGFCAPGHAAAMVADGATRLGGRLPVNTHGGHLSEGYVHGLNHVAEAVNQLRGVCGARQVAGAEVALSTSQPGLGSGLTGAVVLRRQ